MTHWAPPSEKGKFTGSWFGLDVGLIVSWSLSGYLIETYGWEWSFYAPAIFSCVAAILSFFIAYDTPANHPRISTDEREYIERSLMDVNVTTKVCCFSFYFLFKSFLIFWILSYKKGMATNMEYDPIDTIFVIAHSPNWPNLERFFHSNIDSEISKRNPWLSDSVNWIFDQFTVCYSIDFSSMLWSAKRLSHWQN